MLSQSEAISKAAKKVGDQKKLAKKLGIKPQQLNRYSTNQNKMPADLYIKVSKMGSKPTFSEEQKAQILQAESEVLAAIGRLQNGQMILNKCTLSIMYPELLKLTVDLISLSRDMMLDSRTQDNEAPCV